MTLNTFGPFHSIIPLCKHGNQLYALFFAQTRKVFLMWSFLALKTVIKRIHKILITYWCEPFLFLIVFRCFVYYGKKIDNSFDSAVFCLPFYDNYYIHKRTIVMITDVCRFLTEICFNMWKYINIWHNRSRNSIEILSFWFFVVTLNTYV